jgi:adenylate cyclase
MTTTRRLAAILAADVVGYSRLVGANEQAALSELARMRAEIIDPNVRKHAGRLFKVMGDGFLAEFASAVQAVNCAIAIQSEAEARASAFPEAQRMRLRLGVHVGDVVVEGDDLLGDGVNIASRLEGIAEPGGVSISRTVHDQVRDRIDVGFVDKGEVRLKNIARPVQVFAVGGAVPHLQSAPSTASLPLPDKPSIAVLPFQNMSGDPEQEYFADGVVEDIITELSRFKSLFVIARNSSFIYKGKAVDIKQVGRELGVRYVLEGSVRKASGRVRITGQLIDTISGAHVWADRFDREITDIFALQDEVTQSVVSAVEPSLRSAEIARTNNVPTQNLNAYDLYLRALAENGAFTKRSLEQAEALLRRAIEIDPNYSDAWALLADTMFLQIIGGWRVNAKVIKEAKQAALIATKVGPENGIAHAIAGGYPMFFGEPIDKAVELAHRAFALHPNSDMVRNCAGWIFAYSGEFEIALGHFEAGLRIAPFGRRVGDMLHGMAFAHFFQRNFSEAVNQVSRALTHIPENPTAWGLKTSALAHAGRIGDARDAQRHLLTLVPKATISKMRFNYRHQWMSELLYDGLRQVGMPE